MEDRKNKKDNQIKRMISIQNLTTSSMPFDEDFVRKIIHKALQHEGIDDILSIDIAFVGSGRMKALNRKYNKKNRVTDVLSFSSDKKFVTPKEEGRYGGEIVLCLSAIKKQAKRAGVSLEKELAHALIHGTLHLVGYEHESSAKAGVRMHAREEKIMRALRV